LKILYGRRIGTTGYRIVPRWSRDLATWFSEGVPETVIEADEEIETVEELINPHGFEPVFFGLFVIPPDQSP